jgi:hypothetical protein
MPVDVQRLRSISPSLPRFLEFERGLEEAVRREVGDRRSEIEEAKRAREKRARKKRLRRMRSVQQQ